MPTAVCIAGCRGEGKSHSHNRVEAGVTAAAGDEQNELIMLARDSVRCTWDSEGRELELETIYPLLGQLPGDKLISEARSQAGKRMNNWAVYELDLCEVGALALAISYVGCFSHSRQRLIL